MSAVLFGLASAMAAIASFMIFNSAKSAIHEILGMVLGLISAVFGVGCVVVYHLYLLPGNIARAMREEIARQAQVAATATARTMDEADLPLPAEPHAGMSLGLTVVIVLLFLIAGVVLYAWFNQPR